MENINLTEYHGKFRKFYDTDVDSLSVFDVSGYQEDTRKLFERIFNEAQGEFQQFYLQCGEYGDHRKIEAEEKLKEFHKTRHLLEHLEFSMEIALNHKILFIFQ